MSFIAINSRIVMSRYQLVHLSFKQKLLFKKYNLLMNYMKGIIFRYILCKGSHLTFLLAKIRMCDSYEKHGFSYATMNCCHDNIRQRKVPYH